MKLSHFLFELPEDRLAEYPAENRDESKLMVLNRKEQTIEHKSFKDIIDYFDEEDVMVLNNTKVFPARLYGNKEKTGARIEVFLLRELNSEQRLWDVLVDPARKIRIGNKLYFGDDETLVAEVIDNTTSRGRTLRFLYDGGYDEFRTKLTQLGQTPLPKYINREVEPDDKERYQTIFAKNEGAVAAPTAGMHFSRHLLKRLEIKGINFAEITLHVGLGTFNPVEVEDLSKHKMDSEEIDVDINATTTINKALKEKRRICAIGTTSMRAIESSVSSSGTLNVYNGWTNKFIFPPYEFSIANCMVTNFHMPKSTLMMMTSAFAGHDFMLRAYEEAIKKKYNFFSYGDAMLII
ncbi:tRNA preQ1(34) S-adenosylmethionine ribosyltransferase-isomerase QueA [Flavobacteriaceae bacterium]|jgi:S-adenosylmethionine:tRNA ribosyltransferase-isomerase|nr:tRNA preQ1(34) S-adenosylmethionine ribosyltransferase-isomerase QueA [Flavobacteriaceae bacterium]MDA9284628.1 tRNA preQ1(34) S-adenosylmethionine ribosyltransferase-isomerase QueA [Flavobacteriaceae bacterium]MDB4133945.1 tRNA preQ1(34) S-adenosylmethionine ribosyltransferase-isomerase QueA [Flavobacteriaceae bacterium]MDB4179663.1 tRNA preQ1(34) S-adenosylmethionine ribosyltransferase-isomerase QueA [Flavobacteriaceae bacterium]MDC0497004.1 tRNA preQ1(34) S-adenosylmethionine ribosyltrans|tara:strand:+ start:507 stop:1556 length:1050 start_codon:yes stop_codon:yes gene_type:complete